ncbi:CPBP family intramembrane glutamic endopeptidase [Brevibacillus sp. NRS-1366]|uniref:CPBP family intramembrane glutamic endopeptidase n=1 Tax=Brevibacillus sp. NRS-1366 TaxID=3233899 RepID=UPI003D1F3CE7
MKNLTNRIPNIFKQAGLFIVILVIFGFSLQKLEYATVISLAVASLVSYLVFERKRWSIGLIKNRLIYDFLKGLLGGSLALIVIFTMIYFFGGHKITGITFNTKAILIWTVTCLIVALSEEIFVRGYIYGLLKYKFGEIASSIVSSGLFAAFHLTRPGVGLIAIVTLFFAGLLYSYMREKSGAIWLPVGFHFAWNFTSGILGIWRDEMILFKTDLSQNHLIHGGVYGIEGSLITSLFYFMLTVIVCIQILRGVELRIQIKR